MYKMIKNVLISTTLMSLVSFTHAETIRIYAAASLTNALNDLLKMYQKNHPNTKIIAVYGASSTLAKQIEAGANADLYFSADRDWMEYLILKNKVQKDQAKSFLFNDIVLISPRHAKTVFKADPKFNFPASFKGHLCTGQMDAVPIGKYAKQSLMYFNWLNPLKGRIVGTDDVRSALAFVERGECAVGIVYKTDALSSQKVKVIGTFPQFSHQQIIYPIALTKQGQLSSEATEFRDFVQSSEQSKQVFKSYGFKY